jgi:L-rhamnose mutarotase
MRDNADFIAYCLEEYKSAHNMTGKEVIAMFTKYNLIDYVVSNYGALHTMGGLAIVEDVQSLIEDMKQRN